MLVHVYKPSGQPHGYPQISVCKGTQSFRKSQRNDRIILANTTQKEKKRALRVLRREEEQPTVEVAAHKVAKHLAQIDYQHICLQQLAGRRNEEIEGVGNGVGKAAQNEHGHAQQQRQHLALTSKFYGGGHDEAATNGQQETGQRTFCQTPFENLRRRLYAIGLGVGNEPRREHTADDVAYKHQAEHGPVALTTDEARRARIEFQAVVDHGGQSEGEQHGAGYAAHTQIDHAANGNTDAGQNGQRQNLTHTNLLFHITIPKFSCKDSAFPQIFCNFAQTFYK